MAPDPTGGRHALVTVERIEGRIFTIRGCRVMVDSDLAELYGVPVKRLNEQVRRNADRFPPDFAFQMTREEYDSLRSQIATLERGRGRHRKYLPWVFTEHGAIMAANVLNSRRAVEASVYVVRAFVRLRRAVASHKELARKLAELERRVGG
ncbi:MAG TPA: ORF6N domain-containing protein, partial [Methylomirabilota bacterium]|nr:ORF6N domain-containing protein [Methylomirabilota bacterium]